MTGIRVVINDVHAVQAQNVVVGCELCTVIVEPESAHLFSYITIAAKRVQAGVAIWVEIVFPEVGWEPVARETIAL